MRNGEVYDIDDGSNDMGSSIKIRDESLGEVALDWREIDRIVFRSTPPDIEGLPERLYGKVETTDRDLEGYIHWLSYEDGSFVARQRVSKAPISAAPRVVNAVAYVYADDGTLSALAPAAPAENP